MLSEKVGWLHKEHPMELITLTQAIKISSKTELVYKYDFYKEGYNVNVYHFIVLACSLKKFKSIIQ